MSPADRAFVALADHSIHCRDCRPDLDQATPARRRTERRTT